MLGAYRLHLRPGDAVSLSGSARQEAGPVGAVVDTERGVATISCAPFDGSVIIRRDVDARDVTCIPRSAVEDFDGVVPVTYNTARSGARVCLAASFRVERPNAVGVIVAEYLSVTSYVIVAWGTTPSSIELYSIDAGGVFRLVHQPSARAWSAGHCVNLCPRRLGDRSEPRLPRADAFDPAGEPDYSMPGPFVNDEMVCTWAARASHGLCGLHTGLAGGPVLLHSRAIAGADPTELPLYRTSIPLATWTMVEIARNVGHTGPIVEDSLTRLIRIDDPSRTISADLPRTILYDPPPDARTPSLYESPQIITPIIFRDEDPTIPAISSDDPSRTAVDRDPPQPPGQPAAAPDAAPDDTGVLVCIACEDRQRVMAYSPCGHLPYCVACDAKAAATRCPMCRTAIEHRLRLYYN